MKKIKDYWIDKTKISLFLKTIAFLFLLVTSDWLVGKVLAHFYVKQISGWDYLTRYAIEDTKADLLIFGASRAQKQHIPNLLEDSLNISAYNVGKDDMSILYFHALLNSILKRYTPKMIILDIENKGFVKTDVSYEVLACLLPFYKTHPELRETIEMRGPLEKYKLLSSIYPYNSLLIKILVGNTNLYKKGNKEDKGYIGLDGKLDKLPYFVNLSTPNIKIDSIKIAKYQLFIDDCKKRNIKLFIVCPPYFYKQTGPDSSMQLAKQIAAKNNIDFIDYSQNERFLKNPQLFNDTIHVNTTGATIFSNMLASDIKKRLTNK